MYTHVERERDVYTCRKRKRDTHVERERDVYTCRKRKRYTQTDFTHTYITLSTFASHSLYRLVLSDLKTRISTIGAYY